MTLRLRSRPLVPLCLLGLVLASGCDKSGSGSSTPPPATTFVDPNAPQDTTPPPLVACTGNLVPAADGVFDDFEDGDGHVTKTGGRDGTWWTAHDNLGSAYTFPPDGAFATDEGGAESARAVHVTGTTVVGSDQAWGVEIGANFLNAKGGLYDASRYAALSFKAKAPGESKNLRVNLSDVNTHADAGVCNQCWNHFRKDFVLGDEWQTYTLRFADLTQRDGWGFPRPPNLYAGKLVAVSFAIDGGKPFDVWIDDIQLLACSE